MEMNEIKLRALSVKDWRDLRAIRCRMLQLHTHYFKMSHEQAAQKPDEYWQKMLADEKNCLFGLYDDRVLIGMSGAFTHWDYPDGSIANFGMVFIEPQYRGRGLSNLLYDAKIAWARSKGFKKILIGHHIDNVESRASILKHGFVKIGERLSDWPDGTQGISIDYELDIAP